MSPALIIQRDDGLFEVGLIEPLGPFETRAFAEAVASVTASHEPRALGPHNEQRPPAANWRALEHLGQHRSMLENISMSEDAAKIKRAIRCPLKLRAINGVLLGQPDRA
jgi:hypothetical protein